MDPLPLGHKAGFQVAVMCKTCRQSGRFTDNHPRDLARLEKGHAAVAVLLLSHQQHPHRWTIRLLKSRDKCQPSLDHGGAATFHVGASQTADDTVIHLCAKAFQIPGRNSIHMTYQI